VRSAIINRAPHALPPSGAAWFATTPGCCMAHSAPCPRLFFCVHELSEFFYNAYSVAAWDLYQRCCRDDGNTFTPEHYRLELNSAHTFTGRQGPTVHAHSFWSFRFEKTTLRARQKLPAFCQRQAHNAIRHAARRRPARSVRWHRSLGQPCIVNIYIYR